MRSRAERETLDRIIDTDEAWLSEALVESEAFDLIRKNLNKFPGVREAVEKYIKCSTEFENRVNFLLNYWEENGQDDELLKRAEL